MKLVEGTRHIMSRKGIAWITGLLLYSYIFLSSWTDAFKLGAWRPIYMLPLLVAVALSGLVFLREGWLPKNVFDRSDILVVLFLAQLMGFTVINNNHKTLNYLSAYFFVLGIQYLYIKLLFVRFVEIETLLNVNSVAVLVVGLFCCTEFFCQLIFDIDVQDYIPRTKPATATMGSGLFGRSYGFATEPTVVAYYLNTLGPLGLWNLSRWKLFGRTMGVIPKAIMYSVVLFGWITTFSASGTAIMLIVVPVTAAFVWRPRVTNVRVIKAFSFVFVGIVILYLFRDIVGLLFGDVFAKIMLDPGYKSVRGRLLNFSMFLSQVIDNPFFGTGLGSTSAGGGGSPMNWYLFLASESGLIVVSLLLLFLLARLTVVYTTGGSARVSFFMGTLAGIGHLASVSTFYIPFLWIILAIHGAYQRQTLYRKRLALSPREA